MRLIHVMTAAPLVIVLAGCGGAADGSAAPGRSARNVAHDATQAPSPQAKSTETKATQAPAPGVRIPTDPVKLAGTLKKTTAALNEAIDGWTKGSQERPPQDVVLLALHQQRIYRAMARSTALAQGTIRRLPGPTAAEARDNVTAIGKLLSLARPISAAQRKRMRLVEPLPAKRLRDYMVRAEKRFGVEWEVLAAIMLVETKFGRVRSASSAGAQGAMQFMPGTWRQYGLGGDVHNARDAVLGAANYLKASGAPRDYRRAVFAYNHDSRYVDAVLAHARQIKRDSRSFYAYYNWQVFVLSTKGDVRLTGPR
ncbi:lytic transglycosylase domain-containing protein [Streptosporangium sp. NBC_01756]|uniref:lytic transglycosylase domain-containing protein n=1 Tax=Streptosporangium sp. NBC_01756 TaxID=2975950 RepID=UPI002DDC34B1|nr:lytic murein transglycosylase [Streptosporangium sp. NBC_01756]WSC85849.1 lytic murein transglycosylase [Streptosporangium sp. NBC_01756]